MAFSDTPILPLPAQSTQIGHSASFTGFGVDRKLQSTPNLPREAEQTETSQMKAPKRRKSGRPRSQSNTSAKNGDLVGKQEKRPSKVEVT